MQNTIVKGLDGCWKKKERNKGAGKKTQRLDRKKKKIALKTDKMP